MDGTREVTLGDLLAEIARVTRSAPIETAGYCVLVFAVGALPEIFAPDQPGWIFLGSVATLAAGYLLLRVLLMRAGLMRDGSNGFGSYFVMGVAVGLATLAGLLLLVVPAIILMVRWFPSYGILMAEGGGVGESLGKSWDMTRGRFGPLLILMLLLYAIAIPVFAIYAIPELGVGIPANAAILIANLLMAIFSTGLTVAGVGVYGALRESDHDLDTVFA